MELPPVYGRAALRDRGYTDSDVRQLLRIGELTPIHRGRYLRGARPDEANLGHALAAKATLMGLADAAVGSHVTAAVLHGLSVWRIPLDRVHVTRARRSGARTGTRVRVHTAPLAQDEIVVRSGLRVTSPARTVVDLARTVPFESAVALADAALRGDAVQARFGTGGASAGEIGAALAVALVRARRWPGAPAARRAVAFADGRSANVGESRSRVAIDRAELPPPIPQWEVYDRSGVLIGIADFGWPELSTVGEFDGRIKYGRRLHPGLDPGDVVFAEKLREDRLRDQGLSVVRWTWADLAEFAPVADRLRRAFARPR